MQNRINASDVARLRLCELAIQDNLPHIMQFPRLGMVLEDLYQAIQQPALSLNQ